MNTEDIETARMPNNSARMGGTIGAGLMGDNLFGRKLRGSDS
jgi:hypothetical protein